VDWIIAIAALDSLSGMIASDIVSEFKKTLGE
jgi:hypothetical protein